MSEAAPDRQVWVVVPAFNEAAAIGDTISALKARFPDVVVVDDGSGDQTSANALAARAIVLKHVINLGQGAALQTGIAYALRQGAEFIATFDADGQHDPADIAVMLDRLQASGADIAIGSRFLGSAPGMTRSRHLLLKAALVYQFVTTGAKLTDVHNGLRLLRRNAAASLAIRQNRMAHASEIVTETMRLKFRVVEIPCTIRYTTYSRSKGQSMTGAFQILLDLALRGFHK